MQLGACLLLAAILVAGVASDRDDALSKLLELIQQKRHQAKAIEMCGMNKYNNVLQIRDISPLEKLFRKVLNDEELDQFKRIAGGSVVREAEIPWIGFISIEIKLDVSSRCGSTLINPQWVLTAAHCFFGDAHEGYPPIKDMNKISVYLGDHNTDEGVKETSEVKFTPEKVIIHPNYDPKDLSNKNDLALMKLPTKARLNEHIRLPCFPTAPLAAGTTCVAAGWGVTESGNAASILRAVKLNSISNSDCQNNKGHTLYPGMFCAEAPAGVALGDACQGDSGGPLSCLINGKFYISGVTSYGVKCSGKERAPGVYADVYYYKDWIQSVVNDGKPGNGNGQHGNGNGQPGNGNGQPGNGNGQHGNGNGQPGNGQHGNGNGQHGNGNGQPGNGPSGEDDLGTGNNGNWGNADFGKWGTGDDGNWGADANAEAGNGYDTDGYGDDSFYRRILKELLKL